MKLGIYRSGQSGLSESLGEYKKWRTIPNEAIRRAKRRYAIDLAGKVWKTLRFYSCINSIWVIGERIGPLKDQHGYLCVEPQDMGDNFYKYLSSVFF